MDNKPSKLFQIQFNDVIEAHTEAEVWEWLLSYMESCVRYGDVTAFTAFEVEELKG